MTIPEESPHAHQQFEVAAREPVSAVKNLAKGFDTEAEAPARLERRNRRLDCS